MVIVKKFDTETAHIVRNAYSKRCAFNVHGHSYVYEVGISGEVNPEDGMVIDFGNLKAIKNYIDMFDHTTVLWAQDKEEVLAFFKGEFDRVLIMRKNPTAENMAKLIARFINTWIIANHPEASFSYIRIWETVTGSAIATKEDIDSDDTFEFISEQLVKELSA